MAKANTPKIAKVAKAKRMARQPERFSVKVPARFRINGSKLWIDAELIDLSTGGVCLTTPQPPPRETIIEIITTSVDPKGVSHQRLLKAKVVWTKGDRCGLELVGRIPR